MRTCAHTSIIPAGKQFCFVFLAFIQQDFKDFFFYFSGVKLCEGVNISASLSLQQESLTRGIARSGESGDCGMKCQGWRCLRHCRLSVILSWPACVGLKEYKVPCLPLNGVDGSWGQPSQQWHVLRDPQRFRSCTALRCSAWLERILSGGHFGSGFQRGPSQCS